MPLQFGLTREDVLRGRAIDPGFHKVVILRITEEKAGPKSKNPGSDLAKIWCKIIDGKFKDFPIECQFSEVSPGFAVPFWNAILPEEQKIKDDDPNPIMPPFDEKLIGAKLELYIDNQMYEGKINNQVKEYRPLQTR